MADNVGRGTGFAIWINLNDIVGDGYVARNVRECQDEEQTKQSPIQDAIDLARMLLKGYYSKTDDSPVHVASIVLDPRSKFSYCDRCWINKWTNAAKEKMSSFYDRYRSIYGCGTNDVSDVEDGVEMESAGNIGLFDIQK